jgi:hypothetical protein
MTVSGLPEYVTVTRNVLPRGIAPTCGSMISFVSSRVYRAALPSTVTLEIVRPWKSMLNSVSECVARAVIVERPFRMSVAWL